MVPTTRVGSHSVITMPSFVVSCSSARSVFRPGRPLGMDGTSAVTGYLRAVRNCRCPTLDSAREHFRRTAPAADRRSLHGLPRVLRAAQGELPDQHGSDHERGL